MVGMSEHSWQATVQKRLPREMTFSFRFCGGRAEALRRAFMLQRLIGPCRGTVHGRWPKLQLDSNPLRGDTEPVR